MNEIASYPLIVRGPKNSVEIPERFQKKEGVHSLIEKTRTRFTTDVFTLDELIQLLGDTSITDISNAHELDLETVLKGGHTGIIQLADNRKWRIGCLLETVGHGYSSIQKDKERSIGIFHTGSRIPFGFHTRQFLIHDPVSSDEIQRLLLTQKQQPDPTLWMERTF